MQLFVLSAMWISVCRFDLAVSSLSFLRSLHTPGICDFCAFERRDVELTAALNYSRIISGPLLSANNKLTPELSGWLEC